MQLLFQNYGGHLNIPSTIQPYLALSLFANQPEEIFCESLALLITGQGRNVVFENFKQCLEATEEIFKEAWLTYQTAEEKRELMPPHEHY
jgi:hypothetical protein